MEFKKLTISVPSNLYRQGMFLIKSGLFSNFSDLVRSGIREEFKGLQPVLRDFDERVIYSDKELLAGVRKSMSEARARKGRIIKSDNSIEKLRKFPYNCNYDYDNR